MDTNKQNSLQELRQNGVNSEINRRPQNAIKQCGQISNSFQNGQDHFLLKQFNGNESDSMQTNDYYHFESTEDASQSKSGVVYQHSNKMDNNKPYENLKNQMADDDQTIEEEDVQEEKVEKDVREGEQEAGEINIEQTNAQIPYPSREKHLKPCCQVSFSQLSDCCKYFKFLSSSEREDELQGLKYYETNLKNQTTDQLTKLVSHGFLDALIDKLNKNKIDDRTKLSLKIIFQLCKFRSSSFMFQGRNLFFEKLILSDFQQYITAYSNLLDKRSCLLAQLKEIKISLACYHYSQKKQDNNNNSNSGESANDSSCCTTFCRNSNPQQASQSTQLTQLPAFQQQQSNFDQQNNPTSITQAPKQKVCFFTSIFS